MKLSKNIFNREFKYKLIDLLTQNTIPCEDYDEAKLNNDFHIITTGTVIINFYNLSDEIIKLFKKQLNNI